MKIEVGKNENFKTKSEIKQAIIGECLTTIITTTNGVIK